MLHASWFPNGLWREALQHAVWLKNWSSTKALHNSTPYETLTKLKPCLTDLHTWGQKVWVHDPTNSKLGRRAKEGQWMGFNTENHASWVYWPDKTKVNIERNVRFDADTTQVMGILVIQPTDMHTDPVTDIARTNANDATLT